MGSRQGASSSSCPWLNRYRSHIYQNESNINVVKNILKRKIPIDEDERKLSCQIVHQVVEKYISLACQVDKLFEAIFSRIYPTGSAFEGLRIVNPYEYDMDLVMRVPYDNFFQLFDPQDSSCYTTCAISGNDKQYADPQVQNVYCLIRRHLVEANGIFLLPHLMLSWMQSVTDKVLPLLRNSMPNVTSISLSASGPAKTVYIYTNLIKSRISVDLVPVLEFRPPNFPNGVDLKNIITRYKIDIQNQFWFLVPKPYVYKDVPNESARKMWRIHFPEIEKAIIHDRGCVKPVIKMLKLVKDMKNVDVLCSYYIKTIVMAEVINHPERDWNERFMDKRFLEALERVIQCLECRCIRHVFFPRYNLLRITENHANNLTFRLRRFLNSFKLNFRNLYRELYVV